MNEQIFNSIIKKCFSWASLKDELDRHKSINGKLFEIFCKHYYKYNPVVKDNYKNVWLYDETPTEVKQHLNVGYIEYGVDLILEENNGGYAAVQCKYRADQNGKLHWSKDKISNLFAFIPTANSFILFTNVSEVDSVSKSRYENFVFTNIHDLLEINDNFFKFLHSLLSNKTRLTYEKARPKEHQVIGIQNALKHYQENDRGQLILPCGAGKTLTALWIKEALNCKKTIVLVPSLALLKQFKNQWAENKNEKYEYICVCSDDDIDSNPDSFLLHTYEVDSKVTTSSSKILDFIQKNQEFVIFSTYHSFEKICNAVHKVNFKFDLLICDEAHRTAGHHSNKFGLVHNDSNIFSKKRLYMTATPKVTSTFLKNKIGADTDLLYDMSNPIVYGNEFYRMSFKEAIDKRILVDYQIIVIGVNESEIQKYISQRNYFDNKYSYDEIANNYAINMVMEKHKSNHAITFHSRVKYAKEFSHRHNDLFNCFCKNINGEMPMSTRSILLNEFRIANKGILTNARCLTEGIDIPSVDLVYFCDPKNSKIDIVQAVGRALRIDTNNSTKKGIIAIPVFHKLNEDVEEAIENSIFNNVIQVVRAMADHDERLAEEINNIGYNKDKRAFSKISLSFQNKLDSEVLILTNFQEKLQESLFDEIISKTSSNWDLMYLEFENWLKNHLEYPTKSQNPSLYQWIATQRMKFKSNLLANNYFLKLNNINFIWNQHKDNWNEMYEKFIRYRKTSEDEPSKKNNKALHSWIASQRTKYKNKSLSIEKIQKLEQIDFIWNQQDDKWLEMYEALKVFRQNSEYEPTETSNSELCRWLTVQRRYIKKNELPKERKDKLEGLKFKGTFIDKQWNENYNLLLEFRRKTTPNKWPSQRSKDPLEHKLAVWIMKIRSDFNSNTLLNYRKNLLNDIHFPFNAAEGSWSNFYNKLLKWLKENSNEYPTSNHKNKNENSLFQWCSRNKELYLSNKLERQQIEFLDKINFRTFIEMKPRTWLDNFQEVKSYHQLTGKLPVSNGNKDEYKDWSFDLGTWCISQRVGYRKNKLEKIKIELLLSIGFIFDTDTLRLNAWEKSYQELIKFRLNNPTRWPDINKDEEKTLASWCNNEKNWHNGNKKRYGAYPADRKAKLDQLNFIWERPNNWEANYLKLVETLKTGALTTKIEGETNPLYTWVVNQKILFNKRKLDETKIIKLQELGVIPNQPAYDKQ